MRAQLVALAWLGRGDYEASEWSEAVTAAGERGGSASRYLMGLPLLGDYLEGGADMLGINLISGTKTASANRISSIAAKGRIAARANS